MSKGRGIENRFCRCVIKVSASYPKYNPYAVFTSSVYGVGKRKGIVHCSERYRFEDFTPEQLRGYARMKKMTGYERATKEQLVKGLYGYVASKKKKKMWQEYIKDYRKAHPELSFREAVKAAGKEYGKDKKRFGVN